MSIRTIVFDFGNVIGFFSRQKAAEQLLRFAPPDVTSERIITFLYENDLEARFEANEFASSHLLQVLRDEFELRGSDDELSLAYSDMFWPNEHACRLVPLLQGKYRLVLLSNTNDLHYRHFRRQFADTLDRFDVLIVSHEVRLRKPDPRIFAHAQTLTAAAAQECLFLDDVPANVEAARAYGWQGVVYERDADMRARLMEHGVRFGA
jgi:FMN phosphatase YigB (HAD superfamily)